MITIPETEITLIEIPDYKWQLTFGGNEIIYRYKTAPCWFHRVMVRWLLGWRWTRL